MEGQSFEITIDRLLYECLSVIGKPATFLDGFKRELASQWLESIDDLVLIQDDAMAWCDIRIPTRMKFEMRRLLKKYTSEDSSTAVDLKEDIEVEWQKCYSEEHKCHYFYNLKSTATEWEIKAGSKYIDVDGSTKIYVVEYSQTDDVQIEMLARSMEDTSNTTNSTTTNSTPYKTSQEIIATELVSYPTIPDLSNVPSSSNYKKESSPAVAMMESLAFTGEIGDFGGKTLSPSAPKLKREDNPYAGYQSSLFSSGEPIPSSFTSPSSYPQPPPPTRGSATKPPPVHLQSQGGTPQRMFNRPKSVPPPHPAVAFQSTVDSKSVESVSVGQLKSGYVDDIEVSDSSDGSDDEDSDKTEELSVEINEDLLRKLLDMGFDEGKCIEALLFTNNNFNAAANRIVARESSLNANNDNSASSSSSRISDLSVAQSRRLKSGGSISSSSSSSGPSRSIDNSIYPTAVMPLASAVGYPVVDDMDGSVVSSRDVNVVYETSASAKPKSMGSFFRN